MMSGMESHTDLKERQWQLRLEAMDLKDDPYFFKNELGTFECWLCLGGQFNNIGSYISHT